MERAADKVSSSTVIASGNRQQMQQTINKTLPSKRPLTPLQSRVLLVVIYFKHTRNWVATMNNEEIELKYLPRNLNWRASQRVNVSSNQNGAAWRA